MRRGETWGTITPARVGRGGQVAGLYLVCRDGAVGERRPQQVMCAGVCKAGSGV